ncbi:MAG: Mannose-1-phosphate guanylyltransferase / Mannose-6-phosphate isomerase, partial [uncultured Rubrobacteraceae bacterium]
GQQAAFAKGRQALGQVRAVHPQPPLDRQDHHGGAGRQALQPVPPRPRRALGGPRPRHPGRDRRGDPGPRAGDEDLYPEGHGPQALLHRREAGEDPGDLLRRLRRGRHRPPRRRLRPHRTV